jgi:hypothetical protein
MTRNYPAEIEEQSIALAKITRRRDEAAEARQQVEDAITFEVIREIDPVTGKPSYTNDTMRGIAIRERCNASGSYQQWNDILREAELNRAEAAARLERLRGEFSMSKIERRERVAAIEAAIG